MKASALLFTVFLTLSLVRADDYLISVQDLPKEQWRHFNVVDVIGDIYLIHGNESALRDMATRRLAAQLVDKNPLQQKEEYYSLFPVAEDRNTIQATATILAEYPDFFLVRVRPEDKERFFELKAEKALIDFSPYIFRETVPEELQNINIRYNGIIDDIVKLVSKDSLRSYVSVMQDFPSRKAPATAAQVCPWIQNKFKELGADSTYLQPVSGYGPNVVAILKGTKHDPKKYCLMGGHLDAVPLKAGADDNASGVAAALEGMRVLSKFEFENTIRFVAFNAEEVGLVGSEVYAKAAKNSGDQILGGCINFDMIGYKKGSAGICFLHYKSSVAGNKEFVDLFKKMADTYVKFDVRPLKEGSLGTASDQRRFWESGFVAFLGIEAEGRSGSFPLCPNYHSTGDRLDDARALNDSELMTNCTRTGLATLAELAKPTGTAIKHIKVISTGKEFTLQKTASGSALLRFDIYKNNTPVFAGLYTMNGKKIITLTNKTYSKGTHNILIPELRGSANMYIVRLQQGDENISQKYLLCK